MPSVPCPAAASAFASPDAARPAARRKRPGADAPSLSRSLPPEPPAVAEMARQRRDARPPRRGGAAAAGKSPHEDILFPVMNHPFDSLLHCAPGRQLDVAFMRAGLYQAMAANCSRVLLYRLAQTDEGRALGLDVGIYQNRHHGVRVKTVRVVIVAPQRSSKPSWPAGPACCGAVQHTGAFVMLMPQQSSKPSWPGAQRGRLALVPCLTLQVAPVPIQQHPRYRFLFNTDGQAASWRLAKLLAMSSVVLKWRSPHVEYYYRSLRAGTHHVDVDERDTLRVLRELRAQPGGGDGAWLPSVPRNAQRFAYRCGPIGGGRAGGGPGPHQDRHNALHCAGTCPSCRGRPTPAWPCAATRSCLRRGRWSCCWTPCRRRAAVATRWGTRRKGALPSCSGCAGACCCPGDAGNL